ncbi:MAG: iron-containing alcohol dehydrogenase, partial [Solirubrobacterales bacterium]
MALSDLLGTSFDCACGRKHHVPIRQLVYAAGAVESLPEIARRCLDSDRLLPAAVVADTRTWDVAGGRVADALRTAGANVSRIIVPDRGSRGPVCDDVTCQKLVEQLRPLRPQLVVAVGSGVINDLS